MKYLTFKNNYINIGIKFITRIIFIILAMIIMQEQWYFVAFAIPRFLSTSYSHVTCAPYINRYEGKYQLAFCNLREMVVYLGCFVGYWLCGFCYEIGVWYNYFATLMTLIIMVAFAYMALYYRNKEENDRKQLG